MDAIEAAFVAGMGLCSPQQQAQARMDGLIAPLPFRTPPGCDFLSYERLLSWKESVFQQLIAAAGDGTGVRQRLRTALTETDGDRAADLAHPHALATLMGGPVTIDQETTTQVFIGVHDPRDVGSFGAPGDCGAVRGGFELLCVTITEQVASTPAEHSGTQMRHEGSPDAFLSKVRKDADSAEVNFHALNETLRIKQVVVFRQDPVAHTRYWFRGALSSSWIAPYLSAIFGAGYTACVELQTGGRAQIVTRGASLVLAVRVPSFHMHPNDLLEVDGCDALPGGAPGDVAVTNMQMYCTLMRILSLG